MTCSRCKKPKETNDSYCRACRNAYHKDYRQRNPQYADCQRQLNRDYKAGVGRARASERERLRKARLRVTAVHIDPLVVLELTDGTCGICGHDVDPMNFQVDHVVPLSLGGEHALYNLQPAHAFCNQSKGDSL